MNVTFTYTLKNIKAYSTNEYNNIVKQFTFVIEAKKNEIIKTSFFPVEMGEPNFNNFVDYTNLTQQQLIDWAIQVVGEQQIEALKYGLESSIDAYETYIQTYPPTYELETPLK
jgi:hypothetical protein